MKKLFLLFLLALLPMVASALNYQIKGIYYILDTSNKLATVTNSSFGTDAGNSTDSYSGDVEIPASVYYNGSTYEVTSIGNTAFYLCNSLTSVTIPNSVTSIGNSAFYACRSLTSVTIPSYLKSIGEGAFAYCHSLTTVTIPHSVKSIERAVFLRCSSLTSIKIPDSVTSIGEEAFAYCSSLTSITIPASVKGIGEEAFAYCNSLTSVTSLIQNPFVINENVFYSESNNSTYKRATLYVPIGKKAVYSSTAAWNMFEKIEEYVMPGDVNLDAAVDVADIATIIDVMAGKAPEYKGQADVNKDHTIDVADIANVIDIMSGK